ncbi:hypothetical protein RJT34_19541 [Clitoria ternatea]|uniref:Late embryogenesis abundant protein LEA-2 subgroup domain-containing protein n=1 Tax=Clitoria ternatea TaxID=43366 RepID=A0AAN9IRL9_CLITE
MASSSSPNIEPQNEKDHIFRFSPLPQSETQVTDTTDENHEDLPLSVSVESTITRSTTPEDYYDSEDILSISARTCEMFQDLLGLTLLIMLIFLPLYKRLGSPNDDPVPPVFVINSMYLSNFTTGTQGLAATWDAKFTVVNTNVSSIYFRRVEFTLFYKQNPEDAISSASSYPFYLDLGEYVKLHLKFTTRGEGMENDDQPLVEEMKKDKKKDGSLSFGMKVKVEAIYYGETWVSDVIMSPHCEDLKVQFVANMDSGKLAMPNRNFSVPVQWKPFSFF